jgi:hypothetical protein
MVKHLGLLALLTGGFGVGGCVAPAEHTGETTAAAVVDYFLKLDGIEGESHDDPHHNFGLLSWRDLGARTAEAGLISNCVDDGCQYELVSAALQSSDQTADGPTSVWRIDTPTPSIGHAVVKGAPDGVTLQIKLGSARWEEVARENHVHCVTPPDCVVYEGWICVPICTLGN